eukprot:jgi/Botrbrau1/13926/Bobra.136_2s0014.1
MECDSGSRSEQQESPPGGSFEEYVPVWDFPATSRLDEAQAAWDRDLKEIEESLSEFEQDQRRFALEVSILTARVTDLIREFDEFERKREYQEEVLGLLKEPTSSHLPRYLCWLSKLF